MSKQIPLTTFVPAGTVTITPAAGPTQTFALPAVDGGNTSMTIANACGGPIFVQLGTAASIPAGPSVSGSIVIQPGQTVLLTASDQGTATNVGINASTAGSVTFTRGTTTVQTAFTTWDDEVTV